MSDKKGLEGIVAAESRISSIIGSQLTYCGYEIDDLAENALFEEVVFLLWNDRLPKAMQPTSCICLMGKNRMTLKLKR